MKGGHFQAIWTACRTPLEFQRNRIVTAGVATASRSDPATAGLFCITPLAWGFRYAKTGSPSRIDARGAHACGCLRHPAANVSQRTTSYPPDVEVLMAEGRKRMRSAFPPDQRLRSYPGLTRLRLVQPLGCGRDPRWGSTSN